MMNRRSFLQAGVLSPLALKAQRFSGRSGPREPRKKLAALAASYTLRSTADNLITRCLQGYWINNEFHQSPFGIASLYVDKVEPADISRRISSAYRCPVMASISDALTLRTGALAVDGVLLVGDNYGSPVGNGAAKHDLRFDFFQQVMAVFGKSGRSVPVFCEGYLSTNWDEARRMYQSSQEMGFPLMAGSSVPVTYRRPEVDYPLPAGFNDVLLGDRAQPQYPLGVEFDEAMVIAPGGESLGTMFSSLEVLQCFIERRRGGETGIHSLECLVDTAMWNAAARGLWSKEVMLAALGRGERLGNGRPEDVEHPVAWLIEYNDGTRGAILFLGRLIQEYLAAFRVKGRREIDSTLCYVPTGSRNDFSMLVHGISQMMTVGKNPYPIQRNLITTGALSVLQKSIRRGLKRTESPKLRIAYNAPEQSFYAHGRGW